jgi:hypothetical protein
MITLRIDNQASLYALSQISVSLLGQIKGRLISQNPAYLAGQRPKPPRVRGGGFLKWQNK